LPILFCPLLTAAHLSREGMPILAAISLLIPIPAFWKSKITFIAIQAALVLFGLEWIRTLLYFVQIRIENGEDWLRLALILGLVAILNFAAVLVYRFKKKTFQCALMYRKFLFCSILNLCYFYKSLWPVGLTSNRHRKGTANILCTRPQIVSLQHLFSTPALVNFNIKINRANQKCILYY